jgi:hypothetical protein
MKDTDPNVKSQVNIYTLPATVSSNGAFEFYVKKMQAARG